jgi:NitT/TauT family transport system permease protein
MFIALPLSTVFTFVYGTAAARLRRAERLLIPMLDTLQPVCWRDWRHGAIHDAGA